MEPGCPKLFPGGVRKDGRPQDAGQANDGGTVRGRRTGKSIWVLEMKSLKILQDRTPGPVRNRQWKMALMVGL